MVVADPSCPLGLGEATRPGVVPRTRLDLSTVVSARPTCSRLLLRRTGRPFSQRSPGSLNCDHRSALEESQARGRACACLLHTCPTAPLPIVPANEPDPWLAAWTRRGEKEPSRWGRPSRPPPSLEKSHWPQRPKQPGGDGIAASCVGRAAKELYLPMHAEPNLDPTPRKRALTSSRSSSSSPPCSSATRLAGIPRAARRSCR
jgi:hypothetical protein